MCQLEPFFVDSGGAVGAFVHVGGSRPTAAGTCQLDCIDGLDSPLDTHNQAFLSLHPTHPNSHIVIFSSVPTYPVDTLCIPHLAPPSCDERSRFGMQMGEFFSCVCWGGWVGVGGCRCSGCGGVGKGVRN